MLAATDVACKRNEQVIFNPKREVLVLVIITWVFQLLILCVPGPCPANLLGSFCSTPCAHCLASSGGMVILHLLSLESVYTEKVWTMQVERACLVQCLARESWPGEVGEPFQLVGALGLLSARCGMLSCPDSARCNQPARCAEVDRSKLSAAKLMPLQAGICFALAAMPKV